jgi:hypothetical protein
MSTLYRYPFLRTLLGWGLLSIGSGCLAFIAVNLATDLSVWVLGRRTTAEVVAAWTEETSEEETTEPTEEPAQKPQRGIRAAKTVVGVIRTVGAVLGSLG